MEYFIAIFMVIGFYLAISGFIKSKSNHRLYKVRVQQMSNGELHSELANLNRQVAHLPNLVHRNSTQGLLLETNKRKAKVVKSEMFRRGMA